MKQPIEVRVIRSLADVSAADWDACAGPGEPFLSYGFLSLLEETGSANRSSGWGGAHLIARTDSLPSGGKRVVAVVPCYTKSHSWGEYIFDHGWAEAYQRAGGRYFPKLLVGVPFTPVPGPRLLVRPDAPPGTREALLGALGTMMTDAGCSSVHLNFLRDADLAAARASGWLPRMGFQFHWPNQGYTTFEDFTGKLTSHRRKELRRERRQAAAATGLRLVMLPGPEVRPRDWRRFHDLYVAQVDKKWGSAYLTEGFFAGLGERLGDTALLAAAFEGDELVAGALHVRGADSLYGRNWATAVDVPFLHFELCYYRAIDYAIEHHIPRVEAGAQGEHKLQRGYLPTPTWSAHLLRDAGFRAAVGKWLEKETLAVEETIAAYAEHTPYREG